MNKEGGGERREGGQGEKEGRGGFGDKRGRGRRRGYYT